MKTMSISGVNFGRVIAVVGSSKDFSALKKEFYESGLEEEKDYYLSDIANDLYKKGNGKNIFARGVCSDALKKGKHVSFVVTGGDVEKVSSKKPGWDSLKGLSRQVKHFIDLSFDEKIYKVVKMVRFDSENK